MSDKNFQLDEKAVPHDLEVSRAAASTLSQEMWGSPEQKTSFGGRQIGEAALSMAAGGAAGGLAGIGIGAANDALSKGAAELARFPMAVIATAISGRAVPWNTQVVVEGGLFGAKEIPKGALVIESSIPKILPRAGFIGAAAGLAAYGAYKLYENYSEKNEK